MLWLRSILFHYEVKRNKRKGDFFVGKKKVMSGRCTTTRLELSVSPAQLHLPANICISETVTHLLDLICDILRFSCQFKCALS